ncbi:MAG: prolyl oligopeptidase family serine peptidase [Armatimonadota bacterium]
MPPTRVEPVREALHGTEIVDPYRWLEDTDHPQTRAWTEAQNAYTRAVLDALPVRERLRARLGELLKVGLLTTPIVRAGRCFFLRREADQDQAVLLMRAAMSGSDVLLVDPNVLDEEHLVTIDWFYPSWDGRLVAYGLSRGGDELSTLQIIDVDTRRVLDDRIPDTRFSTVAWLPDGSGFYYTRYPAKGTVPPGAERYNKRVRFHRLGDAAADPIVFGEGRAPTDVPWASISRDGRYLLIHVHQGWAKQILFLKDLERGEFRTTGEDRDAIFWGRVVDGRLFLLTNWEAPNWRVLEANPATLDLAAARTVIPERPKVILRNVAYVGGRICTDELEDASSRARIYAADGAFEREVLLPGIGSLFGHGGEWNAPDLLLGYTSFLQPMTVLHCDVRSGATSTFARLSHPPGFDPGDYEVRCVYPTSLDGTSIPLFLIHRRGLDADGQNPTVLTGYGGFNVNMTPFYLETLPLWVASGGVFAVAVLRGGGEFGEAWHRAGMLERKQNVFDDFLAAADWLVSEQYTSRERLALWGGSNGGLLVGAAMTQRPDVAHAIVCRVPLLDMLRYHHFQIAKHWIPEYGSAEDPGQFRWLVAYSPYHHVRDGERYPAVFFTTALGDTRVDPMHARKMAARLQAATGSGLPVLLRVEADAGHGIGKPRHRQLDEFADVWAFLFWQLGLESVATVRTQR